ncbi:MAG: glycosyltransferase family 2 protein [Hydrogenophaga sp.]|uniref:glycosyltransferase n=1 Tax=Hydrogenophaga sp. TaxID=1904254 RepID=UPI002608512B|nr:glycosyltransferase family A protein [Hydrogenophaga sp.]MCV0440836.1 glycosyltransferase family 2 protein [Hydrogenophaga sp.]
MKPTQIDASLGVVAIGRNEGERLRLCLDSVRHLAWQIVYVDSGSTDHSRSMAAEMGASVVELDLSSPFTAARARNQGAFHLLKHQPATEYILFVDGDCEVVPGWLEASTAFLRDHPGCAVVCGRRRERFPTQTIYNQLCDQEWNTPVGEARQCGGDAVMRASAFTSVNGYRDGMIAGEEPELCVRLRQKGWSIHRLDHEMTLHDAAITRFGQWWKRSMRAGHAYAEGSWLHGHPPERHCVAETRRALAWGAGIPAIAVILALVWGPAWLALFAIYPLQFCRLWWKTGSRFTAWFMLAGKFAETVGILKFHWTRIKGESARIIEYK